MEHRILKAAQDCLDTIQNHNLTSEERFNVARIVVTILGVDMDQEIDREDEMMAAFQAPQVRQ